MSVDFKPHREHLAEASTEELLEEIIRRRKQSLTKIAYQELEEELVRRGVERDQPPRLVEK